MNLYFHTSRTAALKTGSTIEREPYHDESLINVYSPFMDGGFLDHLTGMARDGLSLHGAKYLIQLDGNVNFPNMTIEIYYEYIRWKYYNHRPSRLQSLFAWQRFEDALSFARQSGEGRIYEVRCDNPVFVGDMEHLKLSLDPKKQQRLARGYWEGRPFSSDYGYRPKWECILNLPVEVIREVLVNPITMEP